MRALRCGSPFQLVEPCVLTPHPSPDDSFSQLPGGQWPLRHRSRWAQAAHRRHPACLPPVDHVRRQQRRDCVQRAGRPLQCHQRSVVGVQNWVGHCCGRDSHGLLHFLRGHVRQWQWQRQRQGHWRLAAAVRALQLHCCRVALTHPACAFSDLQSNKLNGTIPSSLGNLNALKVLCVHGA